MSDSGDDEKSVGHKRPPKHTRWKKGQSGNPTGRRKDQRNLKTDLIDELGEFVRLSEAGAPKRLTKQRAVVKAQMARAIQGDSRAATFMLNLMLKLIEPEPEAPDPKQTQSLTASDEALIAAFLARHTQPKDTKDD